MRTRILAGASLVVLFLLSFRIVAADSTGAITGSVNAGAAKRFPTVVYVDGVPGQKLTAPAKVSMDQKRKIFSPHVLTVQVGTTVDFLNDDPFEHNVFSPDGEKYDLGKWYRGDKRSYTFTRSGIYTQLCKLHPEMIAYVVVLKNPFFAAVDDLGKFRIPNVPVGTWVLKIWNERFRPNQLEKSFNVTVGAGQEAKVDITF